MKICEEIITSRQNPTVSAIAKLAEKKGREEAKSFRFDGIKLFEEACLHGVSLRRILLKMSRKDGMISLLEKHKDALGNTLLYVLSDDLFNRISEERAPEGVICEAEFLGIHKQGESAGTLLEQWAVPGTAEKNAKRIFLLESVRDPGNLGTVMRTAAAFGVDLLVLSRDCADLYNPKTVRGAMGALFRLPTCTFDDMTEAVGVLRNAGRHVYAAALDHSAARLGEWPLCREDCVVVGNEGHGLDEKTIAACDKSLFIPMEEGSESLNAAVAASVFLWSLYKS